MSALTVIKSTAIQWATENPILTSDQIGQETDTLNIKFGNDVDPWNQLPYNYTIFISADGVITRIPQVSRAVFRQQLTELVPPPIVTPHQNLPATLPYLLGS